MIALRSFVADRHGNAAIEFAFVFPLVIVMLFGTIEVTNMLTVNRKVVSTTQNLADLVTQYEEIEADDLTELSSAVGWMLEPYSVSLVNYGIAHVVFDEEGNPSVDEAAGGWRHDQGLSVTRPADRAAGLGLGNDAIVIVELTFDYRPVVGNLILDNATPITFRQVGYSRPRNRPSIAFNP